MGDKVSEAISNLVNKKVAESNSEIIKSLGKLEEEIEEISAKIELLDRGAST